MTSPTSLTGHVIAYLEECDGTASAGDIISALEDRADATEASVRSLLSDLKKQGRLEKPGHGYYSIPTGKPTIDLGGSSLQVGRFGQRILQACEAKGWAPSELCFKGERMSISTLRRYLKRDEAPGGNRAQPIMRSTAKLLGVRKKWLETGQGPMLRSTNESLDKKASSHIDYTRGEPKSGTSYRKAVSSLFRTKMSPTVYGAASPAEDGGVQLHESPQASAQLPTGFISELIGFAPPREIGIAYVEGDMMSPSLKDKDMVIWEPVDTVSRSVAAIYVLLIEGDLVVQRVHRTPAGSYRLMSDNPTRDYPTERLDWDASAEAYVEPGTGEEVDIRVVGKVLWPSRDTDTYSSEQVTQIIQTMMRGGDSGAGQAPSVPAAR